MSADSGHARRNGAALGWRAERRDAVYHSDLLWRPRRRSADALSRVDCAQPATNADSEPGPERRTERPVGTSCTATDTARAYEMLRASASLAVPLLCLATKS